MSDFARIGSAPAGGLVVVRRPDRTANETLTCDRLVASVAVAGDWVALRQVGRLWVVANLLGTGPGAAPAGAEPPPSSESSPTGQTHALNPTWSGTWRGGSWRSGWNDLVQGPSSWGLSRGAAFFGLTPRSLGVLQSGSVWMRRESYGTYGSGAPTLVLLAGTEPGGSYPTVLRTLAGPSLPNIDSTGTVTLPAEWLTDLASGAAGGIGIDNASGPYLRVDGPSLRLTLTT